MLVGLRGVGKTVLLDHLRMDAESSGIHTVRIEAPEGRSLIKKGMVWSPNHGDTAFTAPMFDAFMRRIMPGLDWR